MALLRTATGTLGYEVHGEGPTLTLLHGFTHDRGTWREVAGRLRTPVRTLAVDLPGHGETAGVPATMEATADAVVALWDALGVPRSWLAGYSLGGRAALHLAARHPERLSGLFTIGAQGGLEAGEREARRAADEELAAEIEARGSRWFAQEWGGRPMFAGVARRGPAFAAALARTRAAQSPAGLAASLRGMGAGAAEPVWDRLGVVAVPCLFVAGELDEKFAAAAARLAAAVPDGRAALVPGAGHAAHLEDPDAVAELLDRHLSTR